MTNDITNIIQNVNILLEKKYMIIDTANFQVAMLDNLYDSYLERTDTPEKVEGERMINFLHKLKLYCITMNAKKGIQGKENPNMLISLKNPKGEVKPFSYFTGTEVIRY